MESENLHVYTHEINEHISNICMNEYMYYVYITYVFMMHVWCMHYDVCVCMCVSVCLYAHTYFFSKMVFVYV